MKRACFLFLFLLATSVGFPSAVPSALAQSVTQEGGQTGPQTGSTGLPLPRFVSVRAGEVNMRAGPGVQYPVDWVYKRKHLPVEVIAEFQTWRKVRDHQGTQGWMHQSMLGGQRTAIIIGRVRTLRSQPDSKSPAVATLEPDVIVRLLECAQGAGWCRANASGFEGWLRRVEVWGITDIEVIE